MRLCLGVKSLNSTSFDYRIMLLEENNQGIIAMQIVKKLGNMNYAKLTLECC